jgi:hypothetical protein
MEIRNTYMRNFPLRRTEDQNSVMHNKNVFWQFFIVKLKINKKQMYWHQQVFNQVLYVFLLSELTHIELLDS